MTSRLRCSSFTRASRRSPRSFSRGYWTTAPSREGGSDEPQPRRHTQRHRSGARPTRRGDDVTRDHAHRSGWRSGARPLPQRGVPPDVGRALALRQARSGGPPERGGTAARPRQAGEHRRLLLACGSPRCVRVHPARPAIRRDRHEAQQGASDAHARRGPQGSHPWRRRP
uniref:Uncharacterized protein n=1 Tax=uncultured marine virus TaxID=186617 RepID=A0A0F7LAM5_9VIRU|nr:hypothetical protein ACD_7C00302G0014 [uncultured marine virus]